MEIMLKDLKAGQTIDHPVYGNIEFTGLVTTNPFAPLRDQIPKIPLQYHFWTHIGENGEEPKDVILCNPYMIVKII
jgi:hypothetical protein